MQLRSAIHAAFLTVLSASAASAATIVQSLPANQLGGAAGDFTPYDITGQPFSLVPSSRLAAVTGELTGTLTPSFLFDPSATPFPASETLTTTWFAFNELGAGGPPVEGTANVESASLVVGPGGAGTYTGTPVPIDIAFSFSDPADFAGPAGAAHIVGFGFNTGGNVGHPGGASDYATFAGTLTLTYVYDVPAPAWAAAIGLTLLPVVRRRT